MAKPGGCFPASLEMDYFNEQQHKPQTVARGMISQHLGIPVGRAPITAEIAHPRKFPINCD